MSKNGRIDKTMSCRALTGDKINITPEGLVYPCVALKSLKFPCDFNNINKYPLEEIIDVWKSLLSKMLPEDLSDCGECPAQEILKELKD
jgi:radical SAM protein with 4Fe4S-binding SPASM domain